MIGRSLKPTTIAFLAVLAMTVLIWVLRGVQLLSFIPGFILWVMILLTILTAIVSAIR